jgi:hypothetical protein
VRWRRAEAGGGLRIGTRRGAVGSSRLDRDDEGGWGWGWGWENLQRGQGQRPFLAAEAGGTRRRGKKATRDSRERRCLPAVARDSASRRALGLVGWLVTGSALGLGRIVRGLIR